MLLHGVGRLLLVLLVAMAFSLAAASSAPASRVYGIDGAAAGWGYGYFDQFQALGVKQAREDFDYTASPTSFDTIFTEAANRGLTLLPIIDSDGSLPAPGSPAATTYTNFTRDFVHRYGPHGTFWAANPTLPQKWPMYFDLWNEPYLDPSATPGNYAQLVKQVVPVARTTAGNPAAKFMLEADISSNTGTWPACTGPVGTADDWIGALYTAASDLNSYFDAVSIHPYGNDPTTVYDPSVADCGHSRWAFQRVGELKTRFDGHGASSKPFWITEVGHPTQGCSNCSEANQNTYIGGYVDKTQTYSYVDGFFVYHFRDICQDPSNKFCWFGLARYDTTPTFLDPKPSYTTYKNKIAADPADTTAPGTPTGLSGTPGNGTASLSWTANPPGDGVLDYLVYRNGAIVGSSSTNSYTDTGLTNGTAYSYRITARDHPGNESAQSASVSVTPRVPYVSQIIGTSGLLDYWRLNDTSGTTAVDSKGTSNGTYVNGVALNQPDLLANNTGPSVSLDGVDDYINFPNILNFAAVAPFTLELWTNTTTVNNNQYRRLISKEDTTAQRNGYVVFITPTTAPSALKVGFERRNSVGVDSLVGTTTINAGSRYHIVADYSGSQMRLYVNNVLQGTLASTRSLPTTTVPFRIGMIAAYSSWTLGGRLQHVAAYNRVLTDTERTSHYQTGIGS
jgi:hypothetical protein